MYEVDYNGQTSYIWNYFYCLIRLERLLYDGECDLLAAAKFLAKTATFTLRLQYCCTPMLFKYPYYPLSKSCKISTVKEQQSINQSNNQCRQIQSTNILTVLSSQLKVQ